MITATLTTPSKLVNIVTISKDGGEIGTGKFQRNWRKPGNKLAPNGFEGDWRPAYRSTRWADDALKAFIDTLDLDARAVVMAEIQKAVEAL